MLTPLLNRANRRLEPLKVKNGVSGLDLDLPILHLALLILNVVLPKPDLGFPVLNLELPRLIVRSDSQYLVQYCQPILNLSLPRLHLRFLVLNLV